MRALKRVLFVASWLLVLPASAFAQATLSGTVKDASGAVLPGVTVEASSPVLIEKVRTATTDGTGQYRLTELPPGAYSVTFTLTGFSTVKREGVELAGVAVTTINADLRVGAVQETITVTGETPIVDVQSARRGQVLSNDVIANLPATRGYNSIVFLVPSVIGGSNQIDLIPAMRIFYSHGGRTNEGRVQVDGLNVGAAFNGGGVSGFIMDTANAQELNMTLSGGLGEAEVGGTLVNIIPKTGGNIFKGTVFGSTAGHWSQGSNLDDRLRSLGLPEAAKLYKNYDVSESVGGPFLKDRLWFFETVRTFGTNELIPGMYANKNVGDPSKWSYDRNLDVEVRNALAQKIFSGRLTAQINAKNKIGFYFDHQLNCAGSTLIQNAGNCRSAQPNWVASGTAFNAPEAASGSQGTVQGAAGYSDTYQRVIQGTWTSTVSSKLLLEAGFSSYVSRWGWMKPPGAITNLIQVTEQNSINGAPANLVYRALDWNFNNWQEPNVWRASASYVTGAHSMKFGYQGAYLIADTSNFYNDNRVNYRFANGVPNQLTMNIGSWETSDRTAYHAFYAQDQWTAGRLTLQGALRYDHPYSWSPAEHNGWNGPDKFHSQPITFPRVEGVKGYNDITPRIGAAYDLFGNGKTSLKFNIGKYLQSANNQDRYNFLNPAQNTRFQRTTARNWTDTNKDFVPDCDLMNPAQNGECGPWLSPTFGNPVSPVTINQAILQGWGVRPYDWQVSAAIQREVLPRTSVEVGYFRRWFGNFVVTDNLAVGPNDFDKFTITAPQNPLLPGGGGYPITFYDPKTLAVQNYLTFETDYGPARTQYWHGFDVNINTRMMNGFMFQGGTSTGRGVLDFCGVAAKLPEMYAYQLATPPPLTPASRQQASVCSVTEPWLTQFRGTASYTVPKVDVLLSTGIQLKPGTIGGIDGNYSGTNGLWLSANYPAPNSVIAQSLGRLPTGGLATGNTTVNLLTPGQLYGDYIRQVDVRVSKVLRFGRTRSLVGVDIYNLFNGNPALAYNQGYASNWPRPTQLLMPRFVRFNVTVDF